MCSFKYCCFLTHLFAMNLSLPSKNVRKPLRFCDVFRGQIKGALVAQGLRKTFFILEAFADYELWENIKGNYTGLPKPKDGPLIIDIHVDLVRVIAVVGTALLLLLNQRCIKRETCMLRTKH